jgi:hypothetical protein
MMHDPRQDKKGPKLASSLLFFIVAMVVMAIGSMLEILQDLLPLDIGISVLFFFFLGLLIGLAYRFHGRLH